MKASIHSMSSNMMKWLFRLLVGIILVVPALFPYPRQATAGEKPDSPKLPSLQETIDKVLKVQAKGKKLKGGGNSKAEIIFEVTQHYYEIQYKKEQLKIAEEVRDHFQTAVEKAEEKMEKGGEGITQSEITKLKLGLSGALNDIIELNTEIKIAKLSLENLLRMDPDPHAELVENDFKIVEFKYKKFEDYLNKFKNPSNQLEKRRKSKGKPETSNSGTLESHPSLEKSFPFREAFFRVNEAREKWELAKQARKITRALLVTEVANYDFGIGDSADLFEALIIYMRVLSGYYETIYNFNMAVASLQRLETTHPGP